MTRSRAHWILGVFVIATMALSISAQWDNYCKKEDQPQYVLLGLADGRFGLVRLKDWAVRYYGRKDDPVHLIYGMVYFCGATKAVAVGGIDSPQYIAEIDLAQGAIRHWDVSNIPNSRKNIVDYWLDSADPKALYVCFSDRYTYYNVETLEGPELSCSRLDVSTGAWELTRAVYGEETTVPVDRGDFSPPSARSDCVGRLPKERIEFKAREKILFDAAATARRDLVARMKREGIIKENQSSIRLNGKVDAILYCGKTYQLCRAEGKFVLTDASNNEIKVVSTSPTDFGKDNALLLTPDATVLISGDLPCFK